MIKVTYHVQVFVKIDKHEEGYITSCEALGIVSQGKTENTAKKHIEAAIQDFFTWSIKHNTIEQALEKLGLTKVLLEKGPTKPIPSVPKGCGLIDVSIPYELLDQSKKQVYC